MNVVGTRQLDSAPDRVGRSTTLHERRRDGKAHEREPRKHEQVDPGEDPQPRHADRQEGDEAHCQRDRDRAPAADGPNEGNRAGVRRCEDERARNEHDCDPRYAVQLGGGDTKECRTDPERERRPEAGAVELQRLGD